jgi:hypothetical protein
VREYLLKAADGSGWIPIPSSRLAAVMLPRGWDAKVCPGSGDLRIAVEGVEVSFSIEDPGWQVTIEGDLPETKADALIAIMVKQLEVEAGTRVDVVLITP